MQLLLLSVWPETGAYASHILLCQKALKGLSGTSTLPLLAHCALFQIQSWQKAQKAYSEGVWCRHGQYDLCKPKRFQNLFLSRCPRHPGSSQPVSTAKQSESIMRDSCICCCCQCGQKQVLMLPKSLCAKKPCRAFCHALVSPLRSVSTPKQLKITTKGCALVHLGQHGHENPIAP